VLIPFVMLLFVTGMHRLTLPAPRLIAYVLPLSLWLPYWIPQLQIDASYACSSVDSLIPIVASEANPEKDLVVCSFETYMPEFTRLMPERIRLVSFPDSRRINYVTWRGIYERIRDEKNYVSLENMMTQTLRNGGTVWFTYYVQAALHGEVPVGEKIRPEHTHPVAQVIASRRLENWLRANATLDRPMRYFVDRLGMLCLLRFTGRDRTFPPDHASKDQGKLRFLPSAQN
jgi:hypothetical protein